MEKSLKERNRPALALVVLGNAAAYLSVLVGDWTFAGFAGGIASLQAIIPAPLVTILIAVVNALIDHDTKARLVFWKWSHPLPGSQAFTKHMYTDSRIDAAALRSRGPLPTEPGEQNALWYRWSRELKDDPSVRQVHGSFLLTRDYAGIAALLVPILAPLSFWQLESPAIAAVYSSVLVLQYLVVRLSAHNHGVRFVTTVLAVKSSTGRATSGGS